LQQAIACYYHETQPGHLYNPALWARKTIDQVWTTFQRQCHNQELYGKDSKEQQAIATLQMIRNKLQVIREAAKDPNNPKLTANTCSQLPKS
jgi:hypothetical protein